MAAPGWPPVLRPATGAAEARTVDGSAVPAAERSGVGVGSPRARSAWVATHDRRVKSQLPHRKGPQMSHAAFRELAHRNQNGLEVTLLWDSGANEVSVEVIDHLDDSSFRLPIAGHLALDAFNHPYAYEQANEHDGGRAVQTASAE